MVKTYWADTAGQGTATVPRSMRKGFLMCCAAGAFLLAPAATAQAVELGNWRVTATASVTFDWTRSTDMPCEAVGAGQVRATVTGRSARFRMGYFARAGYKHWAVYPRSFRPTGGTVTATDQTRQNPPEFPGETCTPTDKSGCTTRPLDRRNTFVNVRGKNARPGRAAGITFDVNGLLSTFESLPRECEYGGFRDYADFPGRRASEDFGLLFVRMPAASGIGRRAFTVSRTLTESGSGEGYTGRGVRKVTLRFTPA